MSALSELIELRRQQRALEEKIAQVQKDAALEAMGTYSATGQKTFAHNGIKVQLQFWKKKPKPKDDPQLERLHKLIQIEEEFLLDTHAAEIAAKAEQIETLQKAIAALETNDKITQLKAQYTELEDQLTELQPKVAVTLP